MAHLFGDSFDYYNSAQIVRKYPINQRPDFFTVFAPGRFGGQAVEYNQQNDSSGLLIRAVAPADGKSLYWGAAIQQVDTGRTPLLVAFVHGVTVQAYALLGNDTKVRVYRGNGTLLATGTHPIGSNQWAYIEVYCKVDPAAGAIEVKIAGAVDIPLTGGLNTSNDGAAAADGFLLGAGGVSGGRIVWDDLYVNDAQFEGDQHVFCLNPNGAGFDTHWAIGGSAPAATNWDSVQETPEDDDVTYVSSATAGDIDTYALTDITSLAGSVLYVAVNVVSRKDDAGARTIAAVVRPSIVDQLGAAFGVLDQYADAQTVFELNPDNAAPWTLADVNGAQAGVKLVS